MLGWGSTVGLLAVTTTVVVDNAVAGVVVSEGATWWWYVPNSAKVVVVGVVNGRQHRCVEVPSLATNYHKVSNTNPLIHH